MYIANMTVEFNGNLELVGAECRKLADALAPLPKPNNSELNEDGKLPARDVIMIFYHLHNGKKIEAIKLFRNLTGWCLKEAKEAIEGVCPPYV